MRCVFCEIPEIKESQIIENNLAWAFPTNIPITPGHTLVSPKRCISKYEDLSKEEKEAIENLRIKICDALKETFDAEGFNFAWNDGKNCGQSVPHFHLHIVPRKEGDTGIYKYEPRKFLYRPGSREDSPESELQEIAKIIRNNIN
ncbi:MAG: HIT domain-containing protein [Candidatus Paceibacterota bacterium]